MAEAQEGENGGTVAYSWPMCVFGVLITVPSSVEPHAIYAHSHLCTREKLPSGLYARRNDLASAQISSRTTLDRTALSSVFPRSQVQSLLQVSFF